MIQLSYDKDGVILQFHSRQTFLDRLLSRSSSPDIDKDQRLSFALADLRSTAEEAGDEVAVGNSEIRMTHLTMSDLSSDTADVLGLPPLVDLTLRTDVTGLIGGPDFRLFYEWLRAGRREQVRRTGAILETPSEGADGLRRIPRWMLEALDVADRFQSRADLELDVHWEALARFRRALDPGVRMVGTEIDTRIAMTDFLSGLEVTLADRFSISPRDGDQFDVVPFSSDVVEEVENSGIPISEHAAELQGGMLRTFQDRVFARGARPAYKLGPQQYLVIDPAATPVLQVMVQMQQADRDTRAAFIRNPRQVITEAVVEHLRAKGKLDGLSAAEEQEQVEQVAEPSFVETQEYSERVIGLAIYERPSIEMNGSGTTWLPESFADRVNRKIKTMGPEQIREMIARMSAAIEKGEKSIDIDGEQIPATPSMRGSRNGRATEIRPAFARSGVHP